MLAFTYWDAWLLVVLLTDFAGDWEPLASHWRAGGGALSPRRDTAEGLLATQQQQFDTFVDWARQMGSRQWERIVTMSAMAEKHRRYSLALAVYEASQGPGQQAAHLGQPYAELQARLLKVKRKKPLPRK